MSCSFLVAEVGFEPHDLRVMSPTSYQAALLRDILSFLPPNGAGDRDRTGTILSYHGILSPGRLPVPPHRRLHRGTLCSPIFRSHCLLYHILLGLSTPFLLFFRNPKSSKKSHPFRVGFLENDVERSPISAITVCQPIPWCLSRSSIPRSWGSPAFLPWRPSRKCRIPQMSVSLFG